MPSLAWCPVNCQKIAQLSLMSGKSLIVFDPVRYTGQGLPVPISQIRKNHKS